MRLALAGKNGTLPSKEELAGDELVAQMLKEAEEKGKASGVTKESVIQTLLVDDIPEPIKQALTKDVPTKETVLQSLTVEEVPEAVKQKIIEEAKVVPAGVATFLKQVAQSAGVAADGRVADNDDPNAKKSVSRMMYEGGL